MTFRKLATAAAVATLVAAPAFAAPQDTAMQDTVSRVVRYADLNLSTPAGVKTLHHRIAFALEDVCGSYAGTSSSADAAEEAAIKKCRIDAGTRADQQVAAIVAAKVQVAAR